MQRLEVSGAVRPLQSSLGVKGLKLQLKSDLKRPVCKESSLTQLKYMAFYYMTTCFNCIIISQTKYSLLSTQSVKRVSKRARFLSLNRIPELVWDSKGYEAGAPSDRSSEDKGGFRYEPGLSNLQLDWPTHRGQASSNSFSSDASDEEDIFQSWPGQQVQHHPLCRGHSPLALTEEEYTPLEGAPGRQKGNEVPYIMMAHIHLVLSCSIWQKLSHCWQWKLTDITTAISTDLRMDVHPSLTWLRPKCLCFLW